MHSFFWLALAVAKAIFYSTPHRPPRPLHLLRAALTLASAAGVTAGAVAPHQTEFDFSLPAQPVTQSIAAVRHLASLAPIELPPALADKMAPALAGRMNAIQALNRLLQGSDWFAASDAAQRITLQAEFASSSDAANASSAAADKRADARLVTQLNTVQVKARRIDNTGTQSLDKRAIATLPQVNGDLTSLLKINPQVQFDEKQASSATGGEIGPAEISIHGAKAYQSEFLVDGMSVSNDLDPGNKASIGHFELIAAGAQALALDAELVCDLQVHDANISAEHGHFTGGVVDAKTCSATRRFGGKVSMAYTSSQWTQLIVDPRRQQAFEASATEDEQPRFTKLTYRALLEGKPSETWGWIASVVRKRSVIPLKQFASGYEGSPIGAERDQTRTLDNFFFKTDWQPGGSTRAEGSVTYAPSNNEYFRENTRDGDFRLKAGGLGLNGKLQHELNGALLTQQLTHTQVDQSRRASLNAYYKPWRWSDDKNWGNPTANTNPSSAEGSYGDVDQTLLTTQYKLKSAWPSFEWGEWKQQLDAGLELTHQSARYERMAELKSYNSVVDAKGNCTDATGTVDTEACSLAPTRTDDGQYFKMVQTYRAGALTQQAHSAGAFAEHTAQNDHWRLRLGLRADRDGITHNTTLAPRSTLTWHANDDWQFDFGANRYYGRSLFAFALQEKVNTLKSTQTRAADTRLWSVPVAGRPYNRLEALRTPHDDELSAAATWRFSDSSLALQYTHRNSRDQVIKRSYSDPLCNGSSCYVYTNDGFGETQDLTLTWQTLRPLAWRSTRTTLWVAANDSRITTNHSSYENGVSADRADDEVIFYDGRFIRYSEMPADNYNRPWTLRLAAITAIPEQHLQFTQLLRLRDGYQPMINTGKKASYNGSEVDVWERSSLPRALTWDTTIVWAPRLVDNTHAEIKLTIENLSNRKNQLTQSAGYLSYERGRTFLLSLGLGF